MRTVTTRTITGRVNADGTLAMGAGFSSRKTAIGDYTLGFAPDFRLASVSAHSSSGTCMGVISYPAPNQARVAMAAYTGSLADTAWTFLAIGAGA